MAGKVVDIRGQRFGRLVVKSLWGFAPDNHALWHCRCDCGSYAVVAGYNLRRGHSRSCGCLHREVMAENGARAGAEIARQWSAYIPGTTPPQRFNVPAGSMMTPAQQRNWQREIDRVRAFEARRSAEWLAARQQERVA